jgi:hypothetical protein
MDLSSYDTAGNDDGKVQIAEVICEQILIGDLPGCWVRFVDVTLRAVDIPESVYGKSFFDENDPDEAKWDHWPTNAMQAQKVTFDLAFELLQY